MGGKPRKKPSKAPDLAVGFLNYLQAVATRDIVLGEDRKVLAMFGGEPNGR